MIWQERNNYHCRRDPSAICFSWHQRSLGSYKRWRTEYFLLHFSLNRCQRRNDKFWNTLPPPFPPRWHTQRLHLLFHNMILCIFFLLSDKIHMFPARTICHSQFFCTKVFDAFLPRLISLYNCTGGHLTEGIFIPHHPKAIYRHRCPPWPKAPAVKSFQLPSRAELVFYKLAVLCFWVFFPPRNQNTPGKPAQQRKSCLLYQEHFPTKAKCQRIQQLQL